MSPFETLLKELSPLLGTPLKPDPNASCRLLFDNNLHIQIDLGQNADEILLGAELGPLTPGPYREKILAQALQANALATTPKGSIAYSTKKDALVIYQYLPLPNLTGEKLFHHLQIFLDDTRLWTEALKKGEVPQFTK